MLNSKQVLDNYYPEVRAWLIQIAAVLDRNDRTPDAAATAGDLRFKQLAQSLEVLAAQSTAANRAERIQRIFSDPV